MTSIDLHLGVHKTASTHLQKYWLACNALSDGVHCPPLDVVRAHVTPVAAHADGVVLRGARRWLDGICEGRRRVLLSDENILGNCDANFTRQALYPDARARLERLAPLLADRPLRILISVRGYADYLRSAWCEVIRHTPYRPFREAYQGMQGLARRWEHVVRDVAQALPDATIECWRYEDLADAQPVVTASLFELEAERLPAGDNRHERRSLPRLAVRLLDDIHLRHGAGTATLVRPSVEKIVSKPDMARFDPWTPEEAVTFRRADAATLEALRALPRVRFVT
jgi:hypothetical protein